MSQDTRHSSSQNFIVYHSGDKSVATMLEMYIGLKIPATLPLSIVEQGLMLT